MTQGHNKKPTLPRHMQAQIRVSPKREIIIPVERVLPDDLPIEYADGMAVQSKEDVFILSFLQTRTPLVITEVEVRKIKKLQQICIAQLMISPRQMARNIAVLNRYFNAFLAEQTEEVRNSLQEIMNELMKEEEPEPNG